MLLVYAAGLVVLKQSRVAQSFGCSVKTTDSTYVHPQSCRRHITMSGDVLFSARTIFLPRQDSAQTVRHRSWSIGLHSRRLYEGLTFTRRHRTNCLNFALAHRNWILRHWSNVIFSDESRFCLIGRDGRQYVQFCPQTVNYNATSCITLAYLKRRNVNVLTAIEISRSLINGKCLGCALDAHQKSEEFCQQLAQSLVEQWQNIDVAVQFNWGYNHSCATNKIVMQGKIILHVKT